MNRNIALLCSIFLLLNACPSAPSSAKSLPNESFPSAKIVEEKAGRLHEALGLSGAVIVESLESGASIAVISIAAPDLFEGDYALEELTFLLVRAQKFRMVDRRNLDLIRAEQQFQFSGEVDDDTAVSIGHLIGAAFEITGGISAWESEKHLRLKALDVETGQIRAMSSISYGGDL
jgi:hypothetical protein